jgi:hypothetical protein
MKIAIGVLTLALGLVADLASAEVDKVTIESRVVVANGQSFGSSGPYERLTGTIEFALDPKNLQNSRIVDLDLASRGTDGRVRFTSDLVVIRPVNEARGNGVLFFEVVNRGRIGILGGFNGASGPASVSPLAPADFGNGYLMREGYTLVFIGWEFDIEPQAIRLIAPAVDRLVERIRVPFMVDERSDTLTLDDSAFYHPENVSDPASSLTVRDHFWDTPVVIERRKWRFLPSADAPQLSLDGGFEPGRMYEVAFRARGARVVGTGFAAIRDAAAAFRYRSDLPVRGKATYVFGNSQSGRFLRQFLYDGFNVDERGRKVFDAVWSHVAGAAPARGASFNTRFGMPVSGSVRLTPATFPFSTEEQTFAGRRDSLLKLYKPAHRPRMFFTNSSVEYWGGGRAAALIHTSTDGKHDLAIPDDVRIYLLSSGQHGESTFPPARRRGQQMDNPVPRRDVMRALLRGLHEWVARGVRPPDSRYPRIADGTLIPIQSIKFPAIPGLADPRSIAGPGIVEGTRVTMLPHLVPQVDADGNDIAGIRVPDVEVAVATNTGWNFRSEAVGGTTEIYNLIGSYIPFPATASERQARGDARRSIAERYRDRSDYLARLKAAAQRLVTERYLLPEDVPDVLQRGEAQWQFLMSAGNISPQP